MVWHCQVNSAWLETWERIKAPRFCLTNRYRCYTKAQIRFRDEGGASGWSSRFSQREEEQLACMANIHKQCILSKCVCKIETEGWGARGVWDTHTHTHRSLSPILSASLLIRPLQLSGWFYHPVSCRKITSDKLGWLNRLGKLADPALPPCSPLSVLPLYGWRARLPK